MKTVPSSGSGVTKAALPELGSAPRLGVGGGIGGSETRSIAGMYNCLNTMSIVRLNAGRLEKSTVSYGRLFQILTTCSTKKCGPRGAAAVAGVSIFYKDVHA